MHVDYDQTFVCLFVCLFVGMFVCLFVGIKPETLYFAPCVWRELHADISKWSTEKVKSDEPKWSFPSAISESDHCEWSFRRIID